MDNKMVCRTCLSNTDVKRRYLFKYLLICNEQQRFADLLLKLIPDLKMAEHDELPQVICLKCSIALTHFSKFRDSCLNADLELRSELGTPGVVAEKNQFESNVDSFDSRSDLVDAVALEKPIQNCSKETRPEIQPDDVALLDPESLDLEDEADETELDAAPAETVKKFECQYCHKLLSTSKSYRYHLQLHSDEAKFLCNCCGERFKTKMAYTGHMATHDPAKFRCDTCGKSYRQAASLRSHRLNHSQEKPFVCTVCGHSTTQKSGLKKHMLVHSGSKSYVCDLCGEHFRFSSNLSMHKRRKHTKDKPFLCPRCPKRFVSRDELTNHSMCHTDEKPFGCSLCGKAFNRRSTLQFHQKQKHSAAVQIVCNVCGRGFGQRVALQNHLRTHVLTD